MDDEIEYIKRKKMVEYMRRYFESLSKKEVKEKGVDLYEKIRPFLKDRAFRYLMYLRKTKPALADKIVKYIIISILNGLLDYPIDELTIEVMEKKLEGYKGRIYVEKRGEFKEFGESLKEDL